MKSTSRLSWMGKSVVFHAAPLLTLIAFFGLLYFFFYNLPTGSPYDTFSFFGVDDGAIILFGFNLSHGWTALALVITLPLVALAYGTNKGWFIVLMVLSGILVLSDLTADMTLAYLMANTIGVEISMVIGVIAAVLAGSVITGGKWK